MRAAALFRLVSASAQGMRFTVHTVAPMAFTKLIQDSKRLAKIAFHVNIANDSLHLASIATIACSRDSLDK